MGDFVGWEVSSLVVAAVDAPEKKSQQAVRPES